MNKLFMLLALILVGSGVFAQTTMKSLGATGIDSAIVTNTGTGTLTSPIVSGARSSTVISVVLTKTSGTVAGTLSLLGSVDGTNFKAILLPQVATAVNTYTATDVATQVFMFSIEKNPYNYYRASWTGAGTMAAYFKAKILSR